MTRYIILEAPEGPDRDHRSTRFIADRFSPLALVAPWIWFLANRLWLWALAVFILQIAAGFLATQPGFGIAGPLFALTAGLLTALEGRNVLANHLVSRGWQLLSILHAHDLETAEAMWFANAAHRNAARQAPPPRPEWTDRPANMKPAGWRDDTSGLVGLDFSGGR